MDVHPEIALIVRFPCFAFVPSGAAYIYIYIVLEFATGGRHFWGSVNA